MAKNKKKANLKLEKTSPQWNSVFIGKDKQRFDRGQQFCSTFARVRAALLNEVVTIVTIEIQTFV